MKKLLVFMLTICLCMGIMIPVQAADPLVVSGESVSAAQGEKFSIDLSVESNPGFAYLKIQLDYDPDIFTFHSGESVSSSAALVLAAGDKLVSWDASANYTDNAPIGTLYFTVSETAADGDYTIGISVIECYDINTNDVATTTVHSTVKVQTKVATSAITSADIALGTDITVNYYANLDEAHTAAQMRFTMNGEEKMVPGTPTGEGNEYVFPFSELAPQCMGDQIKAELILGEQVLDTKEEYSVRAYCDSTLEKKAAELGTESEEYQALETLIADMLEYGAAAQTYRGYKTDALVNEGISGKSEFVELTDMHEKYLEESNLDGIEMIAAGVYFDYAPSLYIKFTAPGLTDETCYILLTNSVTEEEIEYPLSACTLISEETSTYLLVMDPISATDYNVIYSVELFAPNSKGRVISQQYLEYSLSSYVYYMQNKVDENNKLTPMAELARAIYNYGQSAENYAPYAA